MKQKALFIFAALMLVISPLSVPDARANGKLDEVLANMQRTAQGISSISASMNQEKRLKQLGGSERYSGTVVFKNGGRGNEKVRIDYTNGNKITVVGNDITLYQAGIKQAIVTTRKAQAGKNQEFSFIATPYSSANELKTRYNIAYIKQDNVNGETTSVLELTPKGASAAQKLTLWVSEASWFPVRYQVIEKNGDVSTFTLSGISRKAVSDGYFKLKLPSDTKIIKQ